MSNIYVLARSKHAWLCSAMNISLRSRVTIEGVAIGETKERQERYEGTVVPVGNSRGIRLPARFFNAHAEFAGKV